MAWCHYIMERLLVMMDTKEKDKLKSIVNTIIYSYQDNRYVHIDFENSSYLMELLGVQDSHDGSVSYEYMLDIAISRVVRKYREYFSMYNITEDGGISRYNNQVFLYTFYRDDE